MIKVERRVNISSKRNIVGVSISLIFVFAIGAILIAICGANPINAYISMIKGALGSSYGISETLLKAVPLMATAFSVMLAFKVKFWNIGAEGQFAIGAAAATGYALYLGQNVSDPLKMITLFAVAFIAALMWGIIPGILKIYLGINEVVTTLMFNYIAIQAVEFLYYGPWSDPGAFGFGGTAIIAKEFWLAKISGRLHIGILLVLFIAVILWFVLSKTKIGYEINVVGDNPHAAQYAGINVALVTLVVVMISAGIGGLAGAIEVTGVMHRLQKGVNMGYGFTAIIVVWLAKLHPMKAVLVSIFLSVLLVGGDQLQMTMKLPSTVAVMLQGALFLSVLAAEFFVNYKLTFKIRSQRERKQSILWKV